MCVYSEKPESAAKLLAHLSLDRAFPLRSKLLGSERRQYAKHMKELTQALLQAKAGTSALELIMASKSECYTIASDHKKLEF